jgi:hypothetical protein
MRKLVVAAAFVVGLLVGGCWMTADAQVPDSIQAALDRQAPGAMAKGGLLMSRDSIFDVDTIFVRQYDPPAVYDLWWKEVQHCAGIKGTLYAWSWIAVPGDGFMVRGAGPFPGYTAVEQSNFLVLEKYIYNKLLIQHEMLHALLWMKGFGAGHDTGHFEMCELQAQ